MTGSSPAGIASRPKDGADPDAPGGASSDADMSLADMLRRQDVDGAIAGTLPALGDLRPTRARAGTVSLSGARQPLAATATPPRNEALRAVMAWVASLAVLGSCVAAIIVWRGDVARIWPPSERLYSAIGLR
jgi:hypothetical protein